MAQLAVLEGVDRPTGMFIQVVEGATHGTTSFLNRDSFIVLKSAEWTIEVYVGEVGVFHIYTRFTQPVGQGKARSLRPCQTTTRLFSLWRPRPMSPHHGNIG